MFRDQKGIFFSVGLDKNHLHLVTAGIAGRKGKNDQGRITHRELDRVSPLAVPVMLEIGREQVYGEAADELLAEAAAELVKEAGG